jgi:hypothetical protein
LIASIWRWINLRTLGIRSLVSADIIALACCINVSLKAGINIFCSAHQSRGLLYISSLCGAFCTAYNRRHGAQSRAALYT